MDHEAESVGEQAVIFNREVPALPRFDYQDTLDFLRLARWYGQLAADPQGLTENQYHRLKTSLSVVDEYYGTDLSMPEIGRNLFRSKSDVAKLRDSGFNFIHENSPVWIREAYPLHLLVRSKPKTNREIIRKAITRGSLIGKVAESIATGATARGLEFEFNLDPKTLHRMRKTLKRMDINVPYEIPGYEVLRDIEKAVNNPDLTYEEGQQILDRVTPDILAHYSGKNGPLEKLKPLVSGAGYRYRGHTDDFAKALAGEVPNGKVIVPVKSRGRSYEQRFIFRKDIPKAIAIISTDPNLQRYRKNDALHNQVASL